MRKGVVVAAGIALFLTACGGGAEGDPTTEAPTAAAPPTAQPTTAAETTPELSQEEIDTQASVDVVTEYVALYWELKDGDWQDPAGTDDLMAMTAPEWVPTLQLEIDNYLYAGVTGSGIASVENIRPVGYQTTETGTYVDVALCQDPAGVEILQNGAPVEGLEFFRSEVTYRLRIMPNDPERTPLVQSITTGGEC